MKRLARGSAGFVARAAVAGAAALAVWVASVFATAAMIRGTPPTVAGPEFAQSAFWLVAGLLTVLAYVLPAPYLCGAVAAERERRTLELLLSTPPARWRLLLGRLAARLAAAGAPLAAALPVLAALPGYGGVNPAWLPLLALAMLHALWVGGCVALAFAASRGGAVAAAFATWGTLALAALLVPALALKLGPALPPPVLAAALGTFPAVLLNVDASTDLLARRGAAWGGVAGAAAVAVAAGSLLARAARRMAQGAYESPTTDAPAAVRPAARHFLAEDDPLTWRCRTLRPYDRRDHIFAGQAMAVVALPALARIGLFGMSPQSSVVAGGSVEVVLFAASAGFLALVALAVVLAVQADRRRGVLDALRVTPLHRERLIAPVFRDVRRLLAPAAIALGVIAAWTALAQLGSRGTAPAVAIALEATTAVVVLVPPLAFASAVAACRAGWRHDRLALAMEAAADDLRRRVLGPALVRATARMFAPLVAGVVLATACTLGGDAGAARTCVAFLIGGWLTLLAADLPSRAGEYYRETVAQLDRLAQP